MIQTTLNLTVALGHVVLAAAGKTVLRPDGRAATEQLFQWANFKPGVIVERWGSSDQLGILQQIGVNPIAAG